MKCMFFFIFLFPCMLFASSDPDGTKTNKKDWDKITQQEVDHSYKPLTLKLSEDGSKYLRLIMWHQVWVQSNNLSIENTKTNVSTSLRRSRVLAFAQISPRFLILTHWGLNSLNTGNMTSLGNNGDSPQLFLHGAWTEFKLSKGNQTYQALL